jgi:iron complex outermembrane recepter protein
MGSYPCQALIDAANASASTRTGTSTRRPQLWSSVLCGSLLSTVCLAASPPAADVGTETGLSEITITAEKYSSTIQETPISISALSGEDLEAAGISTVEDMAKDVPGLSMRSAGPGQTEYEARGLASNGGAAPTVGFYLDEVPLSPPALAQVGKVVIDPDLYDVNRIEVLRGPQGTLYGSGSMGGTVKVVTNQPKLDAFEGSVQGTASDTEGGGFNGGGNLMLNIPLGDKLAVRVVGSDSYRSGWIDRVVLNPFPHESPVNGGTPASANLRGNVLAAPVQSVDKDANTEYLNGARVSVLFKPMDDLSIVASALYQHLSMGAYDEFDAPPGAHYLSRYEPFDIPEPISDTVHIESLVITWNVGFADLTSATSYWDRQEMQQQDASESISLTNGTPYLPTAYQENDLSRQFSQEVRLTSSGNDRLHWTAGAFYSAMTSVWNEYGASPDNTVGIDGIFYASVNPYHIQQSAVFADGSYKFTDAWKLSAGVRWYSYQSRQFQNEWGSDAPFALPQAVPSVTRQANSGVNPRVDLSYSPSRDLDTYVTAARGFRPGGANQIFPPPSEPPFCQPAPLSFHPDSVWDYELGEKARFLDNRLTINGDLYYIVWNNVQVTPLLSCGYEYDTNGGNGRSFGPELEVDAKITDEWSVAASAAYTDAQITDVAPGYKFFIQNYQPPSGAGVATCLPGASSCTVPILNVPKETASLSVVYSTTVLDGYRLTARASDNFVGSVVDEAYYFGIKLPPYNLANARIGLSHDKWDVNLFVNNLTNRIAEFTANNTSFQFNIPEVIRYSTNQPRTFGTTIDYRF